MAGSPPPSSLKSADVARLATDRQHLTTTAYATADNLAARQAIYAFQDPPVDFPGWALAQAPEAGGATVLDIGCGNGQYLRRLATDPTPPARLLGLDLSPGMLAAVRDGWPLAGPPPVLAVADLQALPLPDACCHLALAMHMLYHVPDQVRAAAELRRVLRPGGVLLAATNAADHLHQLADLIDAAIIQVTGEHVALPRSVLRFSLENGAKPLRPAFASVERRDVVTTLVIPEPGPIVRYAASMATMRALLPSAAAWQSVLAEVERLAVAEIAAHGAVRITTHAGVFVCS